MHPLARRGTDRVQRATQVVGRLRRGEEGGPPLVRWYQLQKWPYGTVEPLPGTAPPLVEQHAVEPLPQQLRAVHDLDHERRRPEPDPREIRTVEMHPQHAASPETEGSRRRPVSAYAERWCAARPASAAFLP